MRLDNTVRRAVDLELDAKGYQHGAPTVPDFLVTYRVAVQEKSAESFADLYAYRRAGGSEGIQDAFARGFEEGTLTLEIIDARSRQTLWQAAAVMVISRESQRNRINEVVRMMLQRLPDAD
jgi:hypothetical protein